MASDQQGPSSRVPIDSEAEPPLTADKIKIAWIARSMTVGQAFTLVSCCIVLMGSAFGAGRWAGKIEVKSELSLAQTQVATATHRAADLEQQLKMLQQAIVANQCVRAEDFERIRQAKRFIVSMERARETAKALRTHPTIPGLPYALLRFNLRDWDLDGELFADDKRLWDSLRMMRILAIEINTRMETLQYKHKLTDELTEDMVTRELRDYAKTVIDKIDKYDALCVDVIQYTKNKYIKIDPKLLPSTP